jgi:hypothetical protein
MRAVQSKTLQWKLQILSQGNPFSGIEKHIEMMFPRVVAALPRSLWVKGALPEKSGFSLRRRR